MYLEWYNNYYNIRTWNKKFKALGHISQKYKIHLMVVNIWVSDLSDQTEVYTNQYHKCLENASVKFYNQDAQPPRPYKL